MKNGQKCYKKGNSFLLQIYIKVIWPSPQIEITLNHTTHAISVLYNIFYLHGKVISLKIALGEIVLPELYR